VDEQRKEDQEREKTLGIEAKVPTAASSDVSATGNPTKTDKPSTTGRK